MNEIFNQILANTSLDLTVTQSLITMGVALLLGLLIAFTYYKTQSEEFYQRSLSVTLCMLPVILSVIIIFVGSNIARAFSLAGTLSIIRFRSAPGDPKDIGFIFFDIAAGLACGVGLYGYGLLFTAILCIAILAIERINLFSKKDTLKMLRIMIPEDLNYEDAFDDILKKYTKRYSLSRVKTTDLGSVFELFYSITMDKKYDEREFINELRCRNGNLSIVLSVDAQIKK